MREVQITPRYVTVYESDDDSDLCEQWLPKQGKPCGLVNESVAVAIVDGIRLCREHLPKSLRRSIGR